MDDIFLITFASRQQKIKITQTMNIITHYCHSFLGIHLLIPKKKKKHNAIIRWHVDVYIYIFFLGLKWGIMARFRIFFFSLAVVTSFHKTFCDAQILILCSIAPVHGALLMSWNRKWRKIKWKKRKKDETKTTTMNVYHYWILPLANVAPVTNRAKERFDSKTEIL